jgi:hypothetical protein
VWYNKLMVDSLADADSNYRQSRVFSDIKSLVLLNPRSECQL